MHDECFNCGNSAHDYPLLTTTTTHIVDGKNVASHVLCDPCYTTIQFYYCVECQSLYRPEPEWQEMAGSPMGMPTVPCPEHSESEGVAEAKCEVCGNVQHISDLNCNKRGQYFCSMHPMKRCSAGYCQAYINSQMDGVVESASGATRYCPDCAKAKSVPDNAPPGYHPYSWPYREGCNCPPCQYLSDRDADLWPAVDTKPLSGMCVFCGASLNLDLCTQVGLPQHNKYACHMCEVKYIRDCGSCGMVVHQDHFAQCVPFPSDGPWCNSCLDDSPDYWFCDVQCDGYWGIDMECECGGVHSYKYAPEPEFQWASSQRERPLDAVPFLGVELEVEAQKKDSTRKKGAGLVRRYAGDFTYVVHDGTLLGTGHSKWGPKAGGQHAFEIVTHPFTYEWFNENWHRLEGLMETLSMKGYRSWAGGRCGIHIHISRAPMTELHQMKFIRFVYGSTNLALNIGQRDYSDQNLEQFAPFDVEHRSQFMHKIREHINPGTNGHYAALNANKPHTLEARWFRGTLNPMSFRKNVEFVHSVWYFTKEFGLSSANEVNYVNWLNQTPWRRKYSVVRKWIEQNYVTRR